LIEKCYWYILNFSLDLQRTFKILEMPPDLQKEHQTSQSIINFNFFRVDWAGLLDSDPSSRSGSGYVTQLNSDQDQQFLVSVLVPVSRSPKTKISALCPRTVPFCLGQYETSWRKIGSDS
jgi:hypothetical protein